MGSGIIEISTPEQAWQVLNNHLSDTVRGRIFFEFMFNSNQELTISQIVKHSGRGRTTINHHINKLLRSGVIKVARKTYHKRGKSTRYFRLSPPFLEMLAMKEWAGKREIDEIKTDIIRNSSHLLMLGNIAKQSSQWINEKSLTNPDELKPLIHINLPFYIYNVNSNVELNIYQSYIENAINRAREEIESIREKPKLSEKSQRFVVLSGFVPVFRD